MTESRDPLVFEVRADATTEVYASWQDAIAPRDERGVRVDRDLFPAPTMVVEGRWDSQDAKAWASNAYPFLSLNTTWGWDGDASFLESLGGLRGLHLLAAEPVQLRLADENHLEYLSVSRLATGSRVPIPATRVLAASWSEPIAESLAEYASSEASPLHELLFLGLADAHVPRLSALRLPSVRNLIVKASQLRSAADLGRPFTCLDRLELLYLGTRCSSVAVTVDCPDVEIGTIGRPLNCENLQAISGLRNLRLDCRSVQSFEPLARIDTLVTLRLRGRLRVLDDGLRPLARAAGLRYLDVEQRRKFADDLAYIARRRPDVVIQGVT